MIQPLTPEASELIARRFRVLADPTRLRILDTLRERDEMPVGELADVLGTSQQNVSKHLGVLGAEGFVARRKAGTSALYRVSDPAVFDLCEQVCAGIEAQLSQLGALLSTPSTR
jgi:DNA-binding transcriptional ArsR family regulator